MRRFFAAPEQIDLASHRVTLRGADWNHIKNVLRMAPGQELWVSDGAATEYHCELEAYTGEEAVLRILYAQEPEYELACPITLFQGLPKSDKMEWIIQKAVELGAFSVVPVRTARSVVRLDEEKARKKVARWQQISQSAAEQSRRLHVPQVGPVCDFREALKRAEGMEHLLIPYELTKGMEGTRQALEAVQPKDRVAIFIGPEGGFAPEEVEEAISHGAKPISLGRRILRTETAGMALLAALMLQVER